MDEKLVFTTDEAARFLGISRSTLYRMENTGLISSSRTPGGQRRFKRASLERYLEESRGITAPQNPSMYKKSATAIKERLEPYLGGDGQPAVSDAVPVTGEVYFHTDSIRIYNADILKTDAIPANSIDLVVTSPPYNVGIEYNSHNDVMSYRDYLSFTRQWLAKCHRLIKSDGRFCLNIPLDKNKGGQQSVCADITTIAKEVGFNYHSTIIWNEQNISWGTTKGGE